MVRTITQEEQPTNPVAYACAQWRSGSPQSRLRRNFLRRPTLWALWALERLADCSRSALAWRGERLGNRVSLRATHCAAKELDGGILEAARDAASPSSCRAADCFFLPRPRAFRCRLGRGRASELWGRQGKIYTVHGMSLMQGCGVSCPRARWLQSSVQNQDSGFGLDSYLSLSRDETSSSIHAHPRMIVKCRLLP